MNVKKGVVLALVCGLVGRGTTASYAAQAAQTPPKRWRKNKSTFLGERGCSSRRAGCGSGRG
jgi:hypothetical protein